MGFLKCVSNFHTKTNVSGFKCLWGMNELMDLDYACIFFGLGEIGAHGEGQTLCWTLSFFGLKFLTALKVGACWMVGSSM